MEHTNIDFLFILIRFKKSGKSSDVPLSENGQVLFIV